MSYKSEVKSLGINMLGSKNYRKNIIEYENLKTLTINIYSPLHIYINIDCDKLENLCIENFISKEDCIKSKRKLIVIKSYKQLFLKKFYINSELNCFIKNIKQI